MKGSLTGSDPAAMIACSKLTILDPPSSERTSSWFMETNRPMPGTTVTLRCLASRPGRP